MTATSRLEQTQPEFREQADRVDAPLVQEFKAVTNSKRDASTPALKLFDTGSPLDSCLFASNSSSVEQNQGWLAVSLDDIDHAFSGDAVLVNDRLTIVFRRGASGAEVFGRGSGIRCQSNFECESDSGIGPVGERDSSKQQRSHVSLRAVLSPGAAPGPLRMTSFSLSRNTATEVAIDAHFAVTDGLAEPITASSACIRYTLPAEQCFIKIEPISKVHALSVESPSRFVVQPDFHADDIVLDAMNISAGTHQLPSENFLLHLSPDRNAIVVTLAETGDREIRLRMSGSNQNRVINGSEISFGHDKRIYVALLEAPGIWHHRDVESSSKGEVISLDWTAPFSALWRVDWQGADKLTKSWKMIAEQPDGQYQRYSMWRNSSGTIAADRKCWATYLRDYLHPCWLDKTGRGYLQPLSKPVAFDGATIVYPISRTKTTPPDTCCVIDVAMATLGVEGLIEVLDVAGQKTFLKGMSTCNARDTLTPIYAADQHKEKRLQIQLVLSDVLTFVRAIRGRIEEYSNFGREMLAYLHEQRRSDDKTGQELAEFLSEMEALSRVVGEQIAKKADLVRGSTYVDDLVAEFRKNLLNSDAQSKKDYLSECQRIMDAIVVVGGNQDEVLGQCRAAVKALRQRAGIAISDVANSAPIVREIRERTKSVLRNPAVHEFPRY